jgi:hypothetical protein
MSDNEFMMKKDGKKPVDGFIPNIVEEIGYGTQTAIDPETQTRGLVPIPTSVEFGQTGQERIVDNPDCYARIIKFEGETDYVYYIRMNARGDVSDPWGMYSDGLQNSRIASHKGTPEFEFRRVKERAFISYLNYLTTRNNSLLRICERDIKDA